MSRDSAGGGCKPDVVVLYCQHCVEASVRQGDSFRRLDDFSVRQIVVPCSSKVDERLLLKMLENGTDGILVIGCPERACKFLVGSLRAERRVQHVRRILDEIGVGSERVSMLRRGGLTSEGLLDLARQRADEVRRLGENPAKGGGERSVHAQPA